ncbi:MAG: veratrol--corrinoid protein metyltransferase, partial [Lachnospiraceae bacterium]|nr:veratrol--corrinoid protein metyltransferase [Lachnospiraceae bacterium]
EGLCALYEEPEECEALLDYICDFYEEVVKNTIDLYKPDILSLTDDTAAWNNPFVSLDMMRQFFEPRYLRLAKYAHERNLPVTLHNCGKCEIFMEDMVENIGVRGWNPAQNCNDLAAIKKKFGNRLVLTGCINSSQTFEKPGITEDEIREIVWDVANKYAPGGGFAFQVFFIIPDPTDQFVQWKKATVNKVMEEVSKEFYKK